MSDLNALHRKALAATGQVLAAVRDDQWSASTPCDDWDARTLANHVVAGNLWAAELAAGSTIEDVGDRLDGDLLGADPSAAYAASAAAADAAFSQPGALDAPCAVSYGPVPGSVYLGHRIIDVMLHGWDLGTATGQAVDFDDDLVAGCWELLAPQLEGFRAAGAFGPPDPVPADADPQTRLLIEAGRHV